MKPGLYFRPLKQVRGPSSQPGTGVPEDFVSPPDTARDQEACQETLKQIRGPGKGERPLKYPRGP